MAIGYGELGVVVRSVRSLKDQVALDEDGTNTTEDWAHETSEQMFEPWTLVEGLNWTVGGKRALVAGLDDAELVRIRVVVTVALWNIEGTVSEAICHMRDGVPFEASCYSLCLSDQA